MTLQTTFNVKRIPANIKLTKYRKCLWLKVIFATNIVS